MQALQDKVETIHLYVVREREKKSYTVLPLLCAFLCLLGIVAVTFYSAQHPYYVHQRLTVPAQLLSLKVFTATAPIIPTGVKTYQATTAHGTLTITNGSIIAQMIPAGFTVQNVVTDRAVYIPAGSANGYGYATVSAHAVVSGQEGNVSAGAINNVEGSSVYIRNLLAFSGGRDSYSVKFVTAQDRSAAITKARSIVASHISGHHYPCKERYLSGSLHITVTSSCQFVTFTVPAYMHVTGVQLAGKNMIVSAVYIVRPTHTNWVK